jgi:Transglutaminase-like superfamily
MKYVDSNNRKVKELAEKLTINCKSDKEKLESLFYYVRDNIKFTFLPEADFLKASEIIEYEKGQCNNKSILFQALNVAAGLESRIHFSSISKNIQYGLFRGLMYKVMPKEISHSWIEVKLDNRWVQVDTFINDIDFYYGSKKRVADLGVETGYSISCRGGEASADFTLEEDKYSQMGAVIESHGVYLEADDYFKSGKHKNNPNKLKMFIYKRSLKAINGRVEQLRNEGAVRGK